jgi:hypothetical protein
MGKYSIQDFSIGDEVYHLSNKKLLMVVIEINVDLNQVICRWIDSSGKSTSRDFIPQELGKSDDLKIRITYGTMG